MKLTVKQDNLAKALINVSRVATSRKELAILNNILFRTDSGRLLIAATNLEIATTQYIGAKVETPGSITVPAKLITEFINSLPDGTVELEVKQNHLYIKTEKFSSIIHGVDADEFPELPTVDDKHAVSIIIPAEEFKKAVSQTIVAASTDTSRAVLTGVFWQTIEGELRLAATDGYRLAEKKLMDIESVVSAIIPTTSLQEVLRSINESTKEIRVLIDESQACFETPQLEIVSRLIDGKFPDYRQLIPNTSETVVSIKKADLLTITKTANLFARESGGGITLRADKAANSLSIHSIASELGENTSEAVATISHDGQITLNSRYLLEALANVESVDIEFSFSGKLSPCILREQTKEPDYVHIIMPMKS